MLPSLTSRIAPPRAQGRRDRRLQQRPVFRHFRRRGGGRLSVSAFRAAGVVIVDAVLLVIWLVVAAGMKAPAAVHAAYTCRRSTRRRRALSRSCAHCPACAKCSWRGERTAYLKVDSAGFDEHNVLTYDCRRRRADMASVNKVILIGNLGADPETRYLPERRRGHQYQHRHDRQLEGQERREAGAHRMAPHRLLRQDWRRSRANT